MHCAYYALPCVETILVKFYVTLSLMSPAHVTWPSHHHLTSSANSKKLHYQFLLVNLSKRENRKNLDIFCSLPSYYVYSDSEWIIGESPYFLCQLPIEIFEFICIFCGYVWSFKYYYRQSYTIRLLFFFIYPRALVGKT